MFKKIGIVLGIMAIIGFCGINMAIAQEDGEMAITGIVSEIAEDASSLVINEESISIDPELQEYMNIEAGDSVELIINMVDGKKVAVDFDYIDLE